MASLVLGIDAGTTSTKGVLADPLTADPLTGVVAQASAPAALSSPHPGWAEAETAQWWENVCLLVPQVLHEAGVTAADVAAVAATGMGPAVIPANAGGPPRRPGLLQNGTRAKDGGG